MKLSFYGKAMHFYMWFGRFFFKAMLIWFFFFIVSTLLIISVPQFSIHKVGFKISTSIPLAIAQTVIGITFFVSAVVEIVRETRVLENDLSFLLKNWIIKPGMDTYKVHMATGTIKRGHMQIDIDAKELSWQE